MGDRGTIANLCSSRGHGSTGPASTRHLGLRFTDHMHACTGTGTPEHSSAWMGLAHCRPRGSSLGAGAAGTGQGGATVGCRKVLVGCWPRSKRRTLSEHINLSLRTFSHYALHQGRGVTLARWAWGGYAARETPPGLLSLHLTFFLDTTAIAKLRFDVFHICYDVLYCELSVTYVINAQSVAPRLRASSLPASCRGRGAAVRARAALCAGYPEAAGRAGGCRRRCASACSGCRGQAKTRSHPRQAFRAGVPLVWELQFASEHSGQHFAVRVGFQTLFIYLRLCIRYRAAKRNNRQRRSPVGAKYASTTHQREPIPQRLWEGAQLRSAVWHG